MLHVLRHVVEISRVHVYPFETALSPVQSLKPAREKKKTLGVRMTVKWDRDAGRERALHYAITSGALRWWNQEFQCWSKHIQNDVRFFIGSHLVCLQVVIPIVRLLSAS